MVKAYSKRMLCPFLGQVQIVETERARALSLDGRYWEVQFELGSNDRAHKNTRQRNSSNQSHIRVAMMRDTGMQRIPLSQHHDSKLINQHIDLLEEHLKEISIPLPAADNHEYWLLDSDDEKPLALIYSCVNAEDMPSFPQRKDWTAIPSSVMKISPLPDEDTQFYKPPVNSRLEQLVNERAGPKPRTRWIKRHEGMTEGFPSLLVQENWKSDEDRELCRRYIARQAPRLLTLHGLDHDVRLRLEGYARDYALEVDRYFHLYPDIADQKIMSAIRVEARLRKAAGESDN